MSAEALVGRARAPRASVSRSSIVARAAGLALFAACCAFCAPARMKLPAGGGQPAADGAEALAEATKGCAGVSSLTAEIAVSGSVGGHGVRGRLLAGMAAPASARLEAVAPFGQPVFIFVARGAEATLLLPRDGRVLEHGQPDAVLEAVTGVPLNGSDLRLALTGCGIAPRAAEARQIGDDWRIVPDGAGEVYLRRDPRAGPWRLVAALHQGTGTAAWRAEYRDFQSGAAAGLPAGVRLTSADAARFDLRLTLSQVELNAALGDEAFTVQIPSGTDPIALDELKRSGPLSNGARGR